jgi:hypothetical protein
MGAPKMKKGERERQIRQRAFELTETGQYSRCLEVERALEKEGYVGGKSVLDDKGLRDQLDERCRIAQSKEETDRRERFRGWIKEVSNTVTKITTMELPGLKVNATHSDKISFWTNDWELTVSREFNSSKLKVEPFGVVPPQELGDFKRLDGQKLAEIVIKAYKQKLP